MTCKRKTSNNCNLSVNMLRTMCTTEITVRQRKDPKRVHITSLVNIVQQCSPVAHDKRLTKEPRRKRTGYRHGKQKNSSKPFRRDNRSTQGPHPPIRSKRTVQSENRRKGQRPSVGANWIPGGHLRFQRLSNSKP